MELQRCISHTQTFLQILSDRWVLQKQTTPTQKKKKKTKNQHCGLATDLQLIKLVEFWPLIWGFLVYYVFRFLKMTITSLCLMTREQSCALISIHGPPRSLSLHILPYHYSKRLEICPCLTYGKPVFLNPICMPLLGVSFHESDIICPQAGEEKCPGED